MTGSDYLIALATFTAALAGTGVVRKAAIARRLMDVPNARSSHSRATPRGGGLAIVLSCTLAFSVLTVRGGLTLRLWAVLAGGGLVVAAVGLMDDRKPVRAVVRLAVHFAAALWAVVLLGGLPGAGAMGVLLAVLGIVWVLNLFNFMDGIDGLAASEAAFITLGAALPISLAAAPAGVGTAALVLGSACCGFLVWNWPPARIFMGDVGSGYMGYVIAVLALAAAHASGTAVWVWLILGGVFFADATVTLLRRMLRRESPHTAHRTHAYQWLSRRWRSHGKVTLAVLAVNLLWLLPCARAAAALPAFIAGIVLLAFAPLVVIALLAGAGRAEQTKHREGP